MDETTDYSKDTFDNLELNLTKIIRKSNNEVMPQDETPGLLGRDISAEKYPTASLNDNGKETIKKFSPHLFDSGCKTFTCYGNKFYYDHRFPRKPIEVEFANDPLKYIKEHPKRYPSYMAINLSC